MAPGNEQEKPSEDRAGVSPFALGADLRRDLVSFGLTYMNAVLGGLSPKGDRPLKRCMELRDSAMYRTKCIEFHLAWLFVMDQQLSEVARASEFAVDDARSLHLMLAAQEQELFILDDLVSHNVSLLEYIGNLVGFAFHGEQRSALKWKGVLSFVANPEKERRETGHKLVADSQSGKLFAAHEARLMKRLGDYRAQLFHRGKDFASVQLATPLSSEPGEDTRLTVRAPRDLTKRLAGAEKYVLPQGQELPAWAAWISTETLAAVKEIVGALAADIVREAPNLRQRAIGNG